MKITKPQIDKGQQTNVIWRPIPGTSQEFALDTRADQTLYWGSRGPGKTDTQIMRYRRRVGLGYGRFWRGVIFDREYKSLEDIISKTLRWFPKFGDGARFLSSKNDLKWIWPDGEELLFRAAMDERDYDKHHGQEYPFIGMNELTKWPTSAFYDKIISCNRTSFTPEKDSPKDAKKEPILPPLKPEVFSTTNPSGAGHGWVKRRFIDPVPMGRMQKTVTKIYNPTLEAEYEINTTLVAIKGMWHENPFLPRDYPAKLRQQANSAPHIVKAWLNASWDIVAGGAFDDLWQAPYHVVPRFKVPRTWHVDRVFDWGSSEPFHVGWWAEANGEEATVVMSDGAERKFCPRAGSLVLLYEWYGSNGEGTNIGLKMSARDIADGINEREKILFEDGWIRRKVEAGPADNQIRQVRESDVDTIEQKMSQRGIYFEESDKSPGSNINGMQLFRDRLQATVRHEGPGIYFMDNCRTSIAIIPNLPRDDKRPNEVAANAENHCWDTCKYRVLKGSNRAPNSLNILKPY